MVQGHFGMFGDIGGGVLASWQMPGMGSETRFCNDCLHSLHFAVATKSHALVAISWVLIMLSTSCGPEGVLLFEKSRHTCDLL